MLSSHSSSKTKKNISPELSLQELSKIFLFFYEKDLIAFVDNIDKKYGDKKMKDIERMPLIILRTLQALANKEEKVQGLERFRNESYWPLPLDKSPKELLELFIKRFDDFLDLARVRRDFVHQIFKTDKPKGVTERRILNILQIFSDEISTRRIKSPVFISFVSDEKEGQFLKIRFEKPIERDCYFLYLLHWATKKKFYDPNALLECQKHLIINKNDPYSLFITAKQEGEKRSYIFLNEPMLRHFDCSLSYHRGEISCKKSESHIYEEMIYGFLPQRPEDKYEIRFDYELNFWDRMYVMVQERTELYRVRELIGSFNQYNRDPAKFPLPIELVNKILFFAVKDLGFSIEEKRVAQEVKERFNKRV